MSERPVYEHGQPAPPPCRDVYVMLTDNERKAIQAAAGIVEDEYYGTGCAEELSVAETLRRLLARSAANHNEVT